MCSNDDKTSDECWFVIHFRKVWEMLHSTNIFTNEVAMYFDEPLFLFDMSKV